MTNNLISINEASGYLNLENSGSNLNGMSAMRSNTQTDSPEIETNKLFKDDRQGRPNMEL